MTPGTRVVVRVGDGRGGHEFKRGRLTDEVRGDLVVVQLDEVWISSDLVAVRPDDIINDDQA